MNSEMLLFYFLVLMPGAMLHEYGHAWMATFLGDPTPKLQGRLSLNPLAHIDWFGTVLLPLIFLMSGSGFFFAYAKPVQFNPYNLKNARWGDAAVAIAGPGMNILLAIIFAVLYHLVSASGLMATFFAVVVIANIMLALFNLIPIPPLDGSHILKAFLPAKWYPQIALWERYGLWVLLALIFLGGGQYLAPIIEAITKILL